MIFNFLKEKTVKTLATLMTIVAVLNFSACSTVEGLGKDIKKGGEVIEKSSKK